MNAAELVARASVVLLDFDGPLTALMPPPLNAQVADAARAALKNAGAPLAPDVESTTDHLQVLRYAGQCSANILNGVEAACTDAEVNAAQVSVPTPGAHELLAACAYRRQPVVVVSNNNAVAVATFLAAQEWQALVAGIVGRDPARPDLLKPHPHLVRLALESVEAHPQDALLIGDSVGDIDAARRAGGVVAIAFASRPSKTATLAQASPDALIDQLAVLTRTTN
ncbi:MAG: HAD family hydrolase [Angustibacter sp.]